MATWRNYISIIYLAFAIAGAVAPTLANIDFVQSYGPGFDLLKFIHLANLNPASQSLSRDLLIGAGAITFWIVNEARRLKMNNLWIVLSSTFLIAFAFGAPLFLFLRERRLMELERNGSKIDLIIP